MKNKQVLLKTEVRRCHHQVVKLTMKGLLVKTRAVFILLLAYQPILVMRKSLVKIDLGCDA
jgi:hypothetical protein